MSNRLFMRILFGVIGLCLVFTIAHLCYAIHAYQHCSIIYYIAKELW